MSFLATRNIGVERLAGLGPAVGYFFALILAHNGQLSKVPLAIGTGLGIIGLAFKFANRNRKEEAL